MDAAYRSALLPASCLRTPVNPRNRAQAVRYKRDPTQAVVGDGAQQKFLGLRRRYSSKGYTNCEDWPYLSKTYLSNQEYYLKLEELKNAHLETMAKLEIMYQDKMFLKGDQASTNSDVTHRLTWETNLSQPLNICGSFSDPEINSSFRSSFSDVTDEELDSEASDSDVGLLTLDKKKTTNAWDDCSQENNSLFTRSILPKLNILKINRKNKKWSPTITIPEPFEMTIRESKKKQQNVKSKSLMELESNLLKKQLEEEAECQKKFRANPVPASVFVPLYHELMWQNEEHRKSQRERRREVLLATQKPFRFIEREAQKKEMKKMQLKDFSSTEKTAKTFKAKPVPKFVYNSEIRDKLKEEELCRDIRIQVRSEELLCNSSLPNSRLGIKGSIRHKKQGEDSESKPRTKVKSPDFEVLHKKFQKQLQRHKNVKNFTICEPFSLHTPNIPSNQEKVIEDMQMDEATLKELRWPHVSARCNPQTKALNANLYSSGCQQSPSPRITESTRRRIQAIRKMYD